MDARSKIAGGDDDEIAYLQADALFAQPVNAFASLAAGLTIAAVFWSPEFRAAMLIWSAALALHVGLWLVATYRWRRLAAPRQAARFWRGLFVVIMAVNGMIWGACALLTIPYGSPDQALLVAIVAIGAVAMTFPYAIYLPAFLVYEIPTVVLGGVAFALSESSLGWVIATMALVLSVGLVELGRNIGSRMLKGSLTALENATLVETLQQQAAEIERANEDLRRLSLLDPLTGLANRRKFVETLRSAGRAPGAILLYIDLDHFKQYNDTYGHGAGDCCLVAVAELLSRQADENGGLASRLGGEEFSLLFGVEAGADAPMIAETVRAAIHALYPSHPKVARPVTASIGYALRSSRMNDDQFMHMADEAAYLAKRTGRNRVCGPQIPLSVGDNQAVA